MYYRITEWINPRDCSLYPIHKYVATLYNDDGSYVAETGKCITKRGARMAGHRLLVKGS